MTNTSSKATQAELRRLIEEAKALKNNLEDKLSSLESLSEKYRISINEIESSLEETKKSAAESMASKDTAIDELEEVKKISKDATYLFDGISHFAGTIEALQERLTKSEDQLIRLSEEASALKNRVNGLLPGATSAGLASAFKERRESFKNPARNWSIVFIASIISLLLIAFINPIEFKLDQITQSNFHMYILMRLPFIVPIIWLAVYASHRHNLALRLEEEYAHKEAISKSFEGYKNQLIEIAADSNRPAAEQLVSRTLEALSRHPGRIYDAKREDVSPFGIVKEWVSIKPDKPIKSEGSDKV